MLHIIRHSSKRHSLQIIALICMSSPRFGHYKKDITHSNATEKDAHSRVEKQKDRPQRQASWPHVSVILDSHARCNKLAADNCSKHSLKNMRYSCGCSFKIMRCNCGGILKIMSCSYRCSFKIMRCTCGLLLKTIWLAL